MQAFLKPVEIDFDFSEAQSYGMLGGNIAIHLPGFMPDFNLADVVIIGVQEDRNAINNEGTKFAPDQIRQSFYQLFPGNWDLNIVDLGNLITTESPAKTIELLTEVIKLIPKDIAVIILGGSQDLSLAVTNYLDKNNNLYNLSVIDAVIDSSLTDAELDNENYLSLLLQKEESQLQHLSLLGVQTYYNHPSKFEIFDKLYLDYYKLGELQEDILEFEPEIRQANFVSIDMRSIRYAEMPAHKQGKPNGLNGLDICKISRLAGIAVHNRFLGIFEYNPVWDKHKTGRELAAQMLWYYLEGKNTFQDDFPYIGVKELLKFYVENNLLKSIFYKNPKTNRWWLTLPELSNEILFPCTEKDYQMAINGHITPRVYKILDKIS